MLFVTYTWDYVRYHKLQLQKIFLKCASLIYTRCRAYLPLLDAAPEHAPLQPGQLAVAEPAFVIEGNLGHAEEPAIPGSEGEGDGGSEASEASEQEDAEGAPNEQQEAGEVAPLAMQAAEPLAAAPRPEAQRAPEARQRVPEEMGLEELLGLEGPLHLLLENVATVWSFRATSDPSAYSI